MPDRFFARVPMRAASAGIGARALRVLIAIAAYVRRDGHAYSSLADIAEVTGIDRRGIPLEIAALVTAGLLLREPRAGKTGANRYTIVFDAVVTRQDMTPDTSRHDRVTRQDVKSDTSRRDFIDRIDRIERTDTDSALRAASVNGHGDAGFEEFWRVYPSRQPHQNPKKPARLRFEALLKRGVDPAKIVSGARDYREAIEREHTDPRYIAQAITFLNQERFADDQLPPEPSPRLRVGMN
jgi:hypothetical protein